MKPVGKEIRRRFPRITMSLVMVVIFWVIGSVVPPTVDDIFIPGLNINAGFLVWTIAMLITAIFLIRALSDAIVLGDIVTDIIVKRLGIKEERSPRRAVRDIIYVIVVILVATAVSPLLRLIANIGGVLTTIATYIALGIVVVLIYDIGRILYLMIEERAESVADRLAKMAERSKDGE